LNRPGVLFGVAVALTLLATAVVAVENPRPEGACTGIGWGCSLYGWEAALLGLLIFGLPFVFIAGVLVLATSHLPRPWRVLSVVIGWLAVAVPVYVIVASVSTGGWA
jgi:hypothetical protein